MPTSTDTFTEQGRLEKLKAAWKPEGDVLVSLVYLCQGLGELAACSAC